MHQCWGDSALSFRNEAFRKMIQVSSDKISRNYEVLFNDIFKNRFYGVLSATPSA